ncbi:MAG: hypothetical protein ACOVNU_09085 [Candidatus Kapaibacteriota bacterium]
MEEFIISETSKIFSKGIRRYAKNYKVEEHDVSILLYIKSAEDVGYLIYVDGEFKEEVTIKDILGVKVMDIKGYSVIAPPYIYQFLLNFVKELNTYKVDVTIYLNEEGTDVKFFLNVEGKLIREVFLKNLLGFKNEL